MNAPTMRALLEDAFYQVLDNKIFRLLLMLVLLVVAPTFLIGFREDHVQILYGWREIGYDQMLSFVGMGGRGVFDPQATAIQGFQSFFVESLSGNLGMVFCVAATAFFIPRMLEKGSADILFSKPVSRLALMFSRYVAGLLFVGILSLALVFGIYLGLLIVSGYNDPGFLWGAVTLIYLFAILHAFSICVGVFTRSTVAAILISLFLFMGSGCVHKMWRFRGYFQEMHFAEKLRAEALNEKSGENVVPPILEDSKHDQGAKSNAFVDFLVVVLDAAHYTLPKTSDADVLTRKLRKAIARREVTLVDDAAHVSLTGNPEGFELASPSSASSSAGVVSTDFGERPATWTARSSGAEVGRVELARRSRLRERPADPNANAAQRRPKRLGTNDAVDEVEERIKSATTPAPVITIRKGLVDENYAVFLAWSEAGEHGERNGQAVVFTFGDSMFELVARADASWISAHELAKRIDTFAESIKLGRVGLADDGSPSGVIVASSGNSSSSSSSFARNERMIDPATWYEQRFGWASELKFNAWFSIATSVVFALAMLGLAWLKLRRIDF